MAQDVLCQCTGVAVVQIVTLQFFYKKKYQTF